FQLAAKRRMIVTLALIMEDERMMHPLLRVPTVDTDALAALLAQTPGVRLVLLNALGKLRGEALEAILRAGDVFVEISMLEGAGGLARLLEKVPVERVLFGSHAPFFYAEAALLKLQESPLDERQLRAVCEANARRLLPAAT